MTKKKWNGKCLVCEKPVEKEDLWENRKPDSINGAVVGRYIEIYGHRTCVQNVDKFVVIPNRVRLIAG